MIAVGLRIGALLPCTIFLLALEGQPVPGVTVRLSTPDALKAPLAADVTGPPYAELESPFADSGFTLKYFRRGWSLTFLRRRTDDVAVVVAGEGQFDQESEGISTAWLGLKNESDVWGQKYYEDAVRYSVRDFIGGNGRMTLSADDILRLYPDVRSMAVAISQLAYEQGEFNAVPPVVAAWEHEWQRKTVIYWMCERLFDGRVPTVVRKEGFTAFIASNKNSLMEVGAKGASFQSIIYLFPEVTEGQEGDRTSNLADGLRIAVGKKIRKDLTSEQEAALVREVHSIACDIVCCIKLSSATQDKAE